MKPVKRALIGLNLVLVLGYTLYYVRAKETILADGHRLLFELAPVDPRSLIQGDYMQLDYAVSRQARRQLNERKTGYVVVTDSAGLARYVRVQSAPEPRAADEYLVNFTVDDWGLNVGAGEYFFQEGLADTFARARYGELRLDGDGNTLLTGLYDGERRRLGRQ